NTIGYSYLEDPNQPFDYYFGNPVPERIIHTRWGDFTSPAYNFSNWIIKGDTSRDQHIGILMALASIMKFVENTTLLVKAGAIAVELVETLIENDWKTVEPLFGGDESFTNGADMDSGAFMSVMMPLSFLKIASIADPERFHPLYMEKIMKENLLLTLDNDNGVHNLFPAFYPANLNWETIWSLMVFENDPLIRRNLLKVLEGEYDTIKCLKNAFFQSLYISLNPSENPKSAAANSTKKDRIINEIKDALARKADDLWIGGPNYYPEPDLSEIGLNFSSEEDRDSLLDPTIGNIIDDIPTIVRETLYNLLDYDFDQYRERTYYALPIDYRPDEDWCWQRSPYKLRPGATDMKQNEPYHADTTTIYWWARWMNWLQAPDAGLNIHPVTVSNAEIFAYFGGAARGLPVGYPSSYSLIDAFK
ncbi:MAG: hypothetical protein ACTSU9_07910, partial [Promethearchaeota archaeon]